MVVPAFQIRLAPSLDYDTSPESSLQRTKRPSSGHSSKERAGRNVAMDSTPSVIFNRPKLPSDPWVDASTRGQSWRQLYETAIGSPAIGSLEWHRATRFWRGPPRETVRSHRAPQAQLPAREGRGRQAPGPHSRRTRQHPCIRGNAVPVSPRRAPFPPPPEGDPPRRSSLPPRARCRGGAGQAAGVCPVRQNGGAGSHPQVRAGAVPPAEHPAAYRRAPGCWCVSVKQRPSGEGLGDVPRLCADALRRGARGVPGRLPTVGEEFLQSAGRAVEEAGEG